MDLKKTIESEMRAALKAKNAEHLGVFRMLLAAFKNREIEKRGKGGEETLNEDETMAVLKSEVKKRRDSIAEFQKAGRTDLAEKETAELAVLEPYLPAEMSDEEIEKLLLPMVKGASADDFGKVMGQAMKAVAGKASGDRVNAIVKRLLTGSSRPD